MALDHSRSQATAPPRSRTLPAIAALLAAGALLLVGLVGAVGCARPQPAEPQPADVVRAYLAAIERGDADAAWDLLDPALRGERSREDFRGFVERNRAELLEQARAALAAATERPAEMRAVVRVGDDDVTVVREPDGWRLAAPYWPATPAATPAAALRGLRGALARGDLATARDAYLAPGARADLDAFLAALAAAAAAAPDASAEDEVTVPIEGGGAVVLRRAGGHWRIESIRLP